MVTLGMFVKGRQLFCGLFKQGLDAVSYTNLDNQPDFTWLQPYEEKSWVQYFMPYSDVGYVKNATKDALLNLEIKEGKARLVLYTTGRCV